MATVENSVFATTATIADTESLSGAINISGRGASIVGLVMPDTWDAAALTFQGSYDGTTFFDLFTTSGDEVTISSPAADAWYLIAPGDFAGVPYLKIRSGTSATPVAQTGDRAIVVLSRNV